jgi:hypothetical protein
MKKTVDSRPSLTIRDTPHKHYVVRLPIALAARLEALCEMTPRKRREQIIGELLALGLTELERCATDRDQGGVEMGLAPSGPLYLPIGAFSEFHNLVRKHHYALEQAATEPAPDPAGLEEGYYLDDRQ